MRTLLLLRHAKSDWSHPELADHDRPLNRRGKRNAERSGRFMIYRLASPDVCGVLCAAETVLKDAGGAVAACPNYRER